MGAGAVVYMEDGLGLETGVTVFREDTLDGLGAAAGYDRLLKGPCYAALSLRLSPRG